MVKSDLVEELFFELASESRAGILRELSSRNLKMQELARKLDLTDTETFRQVQRLSEALLIQKNADGTYAVTPYGKIVLYLSKSIVFVHNNRDRFMTRDVWRLPEEFIDRLGELSGGRFITDMFEMFNGANTAIGAAEEYVWMIGDKPIPSMDATLSKLASKGVKLRLIFSETLAAEYEGALRNMHFVESKMISGEVPATLVVTEKVAGVSLLSIDSREDYMLLYGEDSGFLKWARDLFQFYWMKE